MRFQALIPAVSVPDSCYWTLLAEPNHATIESNKMEAGTMKLKFKQSLATVICVGALLAGGEMAYADDASSLNQAHIAQ